MYATDSEVIIYAVEHVIDPHLDWDAKALVFGQLWWNVQREWAPSGGLFREAYEKAKHGDWIGCE